jgi:hypothetical protein
MSANCNTLLQEKVSDYRPRHPNLNKHLPAHFPFFLFFSLLHNSLMFNKNVGSWRAICFSKLRKNCAPLLTCLVGRQAYPGIEKCHTS